MCGGKLYVPNIGAQPEPPLFFNVNVQALVGVVDTASLTERTDLTVNLNAQIKTEPKPGEPDGQPRPSVRQRRRRHRRRQEVRDVSDRQSGRQLRAARASQRAASSTSARRTVWSVSRPATSRPASSSTAREARLRQQRGWIVRLDLEPRRQQRHRPRRAVEHAPRAGKPRRRRPEGTAGVLHRARHPGQRPLASRHSRHRPAPVTRQAIERRVEQLRLVPSVRPRGRRHLAVRRRAA